MTCPKCDQETSGRLFAQIGTSTDHVSPVVVAEAARSKNVRAVTHSRLTQIAALILIAITVTACGSQSPANKPAPPQPAKTFQQCPEVLALRQRQATYRAEADQLETQAQQVMDAAIANPDQFQADMGRTRAETMRSEALRLRNYDEPLVIANCYLSNG